MEKLDSNDSESVPLVVATYGEDFESSSVISRGRAFDTISLSCTYSRLVDTVTCCGSEALEELATPTGH
jgi:hypothetical protein